MIMQKIIFPAPASGLMTAISAASFIGITASGISEVRGKHLQYSKFWKAGSQNRSPLIKQIKLPSRAGMLLLYAPAFLAGAASFFLFPDEGLRFLLVQLAVSIHFFKRIFEVLFIHKYSGGMILDSALTISLSYFVSSAFMIYAQHLTHGSTEPAVDLMYSGVLVYVIGICGNFYHHYLLSELRGNEGEKEYKIPRGGLFDLVICPHYLFEILIFWGIFFISQTVYAFCFALATTFYLMGRSYATRKWYLSKFDHFPNHVKALIPFVF